MPDRPPPRRVVARSVAPPPSGRSRRPAPFGGHPLFVPGLAVAVGLAVVAGVSGAVLAVRELQRNAAAPPLVAAESTPSTKPATATQPIPARPAADAAAITTPEPADAHPGLTTPDPLDVQYPLPRDPARIQALIAERRAWYAAQLNADAAKTHRFYADAVRAATDTQIEVLAHEHHRSIDRIARRRAALTKAVDAGCDDPALMYAVNRHVTPEQAGCQVFQKAAFQLDGGGYSPFRRLHAGYNAAVTTHEQMPWMPVTNPLKAFAGAVADLSRTPDRTADMELFGVYALALHAPLFGPDVHARYKRLSDGLVAAGASAWLRKMVDGAHHIAWAWEARGTGLAKTVTDDGWRLFHERLTAAEEALAAAHQLAPDRPQAAGRMVTVCLGQGYDRDVMEQWFAQAMTADPDHLPAVEAKLEYLKPKWHGSADELLAFARQCLRAAGPDDYLGEMLYLAYDELRAREDSDTFWQRPGLWADLRAAYEPHLAASPDDHLARTRFFRVCALSGQWVAADAHRRRLGDNWVRTEFKKPDDWKTLTDLVAGKLRQPQP